MIFLDRQLCNMLILSHLYLDKGSRVFGSWFFRNNTRAFTLPEVMLAVGIVSLLVIANFTAISMNRLQNAKESERSIMVDFGIHYLELVKGLPFEETMQGMPINGLYDGKNSALLIPLPSTENWMSINDPTYQTFHPDLVWLEPRNPKMRVSLTTTQAGGADHTKHIKLELQWDAPMDIGAKQTLRLDMVKEKDL